MELFFDTRPEWIESVRAWASDSENVAKVWIFGSRAMGQRTPKDSPPVVPDLDLGFTLKGRANETPGELDALVICNRQLWVERLACDIPVPIDLQYAEPASDERVWPAIQAHGVLIYSREGS